MGSGIHIHVCMNDCFCMSAMYSLQQRVMYAIKDPLSRVLLIHNAEISTSACTHNGLCLWAQQVCL